MIKLIGKVLNGTRKGKAVLLAEAFAAGLLSKITSLDANVKKFAPNRAGYNAMTDGDKVPKCYITGRTCSNDHYMVTVGGKELPVGVSIGRLLIGILSSAKDDMGVETGIKKAVADEASKAAAK